MEMLAKFICELGGCLWNRIANDEAGVSGIGDSLREEVVGHLGTHATEADKTDAVCTRARRLTENASGKPHEGVNSVSSGRE